MTWSDLVCAYIVVVCLWGDRLLAWRDRMVALDAAGGVWPERHLRAAGDAQ